MIHSAGLRNLLGLCRRTRLESSSNSCMRCHSMHDVARQRRHRDGMAWCHCCVLLLLFMGAQATVLPGRKSHVCFTEGF